MLETDKMKEVIRNELGVFDDDPSVYLLVKDLSVYDTDHTIAYRSFPDDADSCFNGTVIFTKMDDFGFASLSNNDIDIIRNRLCRLPNELFEFFLISIRFFCDMIERILTSHIIFKVLIW